MDLQAERLGPARDRLADAAHADDAEALAGEAAAHHPGRRPAIELAAFHDLHALVQAARHGEDQRHGDIGSIVGQHARRVGHGDAALHGAGDINVVHPGPELGDQAQLLAGPGHQAPVDPVGHRRHQHVGGLHRLGELFGRQRDVCLVQSGVEQFFHPQFHRRRQLAGYDDFQLRCRHGTPVDHSYCHCRLPEHPRRANDPLFYLGFM